MYGTHGVILTLIHKTNLPVLKQQLSYFRENFKTENSTFEWRDYTLALGFQ
jgi:hypothetical protein